MTEKKKVEKGDFVEIEFTGKTKEGRVFDTTDAETAKKNDFFNQNAVYGPKVICVGERHLLKGIDEQLVGKGLEKNYEIELKPEEAFGKKSAKMLRLVPMGVFRRQKIEPVPGLQVIMDNGLGTIRTVSGGRIIVDFNHPLAGKEIIYEIKIDRILEEPGEKVTSLTRVYLNTDAKIELKGEKTLIQLKQKFPKEITDMLSAGIKRLIPQITEVEITEEKE